MAELGKFILRSAKFMQAQTQTRVTNTSFSFDPLASRLPVAIFRSICFLFLKDPTEYPSQCHGTTAGFLELLELLNIIRSFSIFFSSCYPHSHSYSHVSKYHLLGIDATTLLRSSTQPACSSSALPPTAAKREMQ